MIELADFPPKGEYFRLTKTALLRWQALLA
jgi:hypothetical protein